MPELDRAQGSLAPQEIGYASPGSGLNIGVDARAMVGLSAALLDRRLLTKTIPAPPIANLPRCTRCLTLQRRLATRTKTKSPQTNGICERFHKTVLNEFYRIAFRKKVYRSIDELQADLDTWIAEYNETRPHQGRWCFGKTPMQTFLDAMPMTKEKMIAA